MCVPSTICHPDDSRQPDFNVAVIKFLIRRACYWIPTVVAMMGWRTNVIPRASYSSAPRSSFQRHVDDNFFQVLLIRLSRSFAVSQLAGHHKNHPPSVYGGPIFWLDLLIHFAKSIFLSVYGGYSLHLCHLPFVRQIRVIHKMLTAYCRITQTGTKHVNDGCEYTKHV